MIVQTTNIQKSFNKTIILDNINLTVNKGDIFGIVGPDGAGKTTFLRCLLDLYKIDNGQILLFGSSDLQNCKNKIGYVPQQFSLNTDMTVWENICVFAKLQSMSEQAIAERGDELLKMLWLDKFKDRLAGNLSGGMKQKLALVCSIMHKPELLILDEPTTGVDPVSRREFWQALYKLNQQEMTLLLCTPYMDEVELCSKIAFFYQGQIQVTGSPNELLQNYPYKLFSIKAPNLRQIFDKLSQNPMLNIYLKGQDLCVLIKEPIQMPLLKENLALAGITDYEIFPLEPTLEDLFSLLTEQTDV